jgi:hypothetical protein
MASAPAKKIHLRYIVHLKGVQSDVLDAIFAIHDRVVNSKDRGKILCIKTPDIARKCVDSTFKVPQGSCHAATGASCRVRRLFDGIRNGVQHVSDAILSTVCMRRAKHVGKSRPSARAVTVTVACNGHLTAVCCHRNWRCRRLHARM